MPASSAEVIGVVLQSAFRLPPAPHRPPKAPDSLQDQLSVCGRQILTNPVEYENAGCQQMLVLDSLKTKYVTLTTQSSPAPPAPPSTHAMAQGHARGKDDQLEEPQVVLWSRDKVTLGWRKTFPPGAGMVNLGNTCYLNSSLQALFHIPSLANWLLEELQTHTQRCETNTTNASFCSVCAMMRTLRATLDRSSPVIKPALIQHKLKCIGKTLMYGRQEDAHEFIKLLLDHMEKSYLSFRRASKLDHRSKETTPLNQIFGGYLRQQVICPLCRYVSTTFSHFQDLVLDIRSVSSVDEALNLHFRKETLDSENAYKCERCRRKVPATKRHLIERPPHVLLIQLKRFTMNGGKIGKHINIQRTIDLSRFINASGKQGGGGGPGGAYQYRLTSMVIHLGGSQHGGHYTAVAEASNGTMFEFDDSSVRPISLQSALLRNPYILFYEMVRRPKDAHHQGALKQVVRQSSEKSLLRQSSDAVPHAKSLPTSHSASSVANGYHHHQHGDGGGGGKALAPPLPCHKERERLSFAIKSTQGRAVVESSPRPSKIILNNSTTSLLGTKNPSSAAPSAAKTSSTPTPQASKSASSTPTPGKTPAAAKSTGNPTKSVSVKSAATPSIPKASTAPSSTAKTSSTASSTAKASSTTSSTCKTPATTSSNATKVLSSVSKTNGKGPALNATSVKAAPLVPYLDDSEESETDDSRRNGAKDKRMNGKCPKERKIANGDEKMVPRSLQVSKKDGWEVTDAALYSPSESSSGSNSGMRPFTVVEQPVSSSRTEIEADTQGWTVTTVQEKRRIRPELEKSLSHDSALPPQRTDSQGGEGDSASLRSKASVDSNRSDRSTKSMKRSIFSLFTCVSSTRSPESPPEPTAPPGLHKPSTASSDTPGASTTSSGASNSSDKSKRSRDEHEEPSSPSKKTCNGTKSDTDEKANVEETITTTATTATTTAASTTATTAGPSKNGLPPHPPSPEPKNASEKAKNGSDATTNHSGKSSSTSTSSLSSSDSEEEEEERWVEKTQETMGAARLHPSPVIVEWNGERKERKNGLWDGSRSSAVVDELRRAGNSAYGAEVNAWGGGRSVLDQEAERGRKEARKRTADDLYNEDMDSGRMKKLKSHKRNWNGGASNSHPQNSHSGYHNPFQRLQDNRNYYNNNNNYYNNHYNHHSNHYRNQNRPYSWRRKQFHSKYGEKYKKW